VLAVGNADRQHPKIFLFPATCPVLFTGLGGESLRMFHIAFHLCEAVFNHPKELGVIKYCDKYIDK
jgi:hypothetical protein